MECFLEIVRISEKIPASFWGVLIGAFFSIFGVWLTNKASDKRLTKQFENDRNAKAKEREMDLRKEIFLDATDAMTTGVYSIMNFADLELSNVEITKKYIEKAPALAKINVIANMETIKNIANFSSELSALFLKYFSKRSVLVENYKSIIFWDKEIEKIRSEKSNLLEQMKQYNLEGLNDISKWNIYQRNYDFAEAARKKLQDTIDELSSEIRPKQIILMRECMDDVMKLAEVQALILASVRKELELGFDKNMYANILNSAIEKSKVTFDKYFQ